MTNMKPLYSRHPTMANVGYRHGLVGTYNQSLADMSEQYHDCYYMAKLRVMVASIKARSIHHKGK